LIAYLLKIIPDAWRLFEQGQIYPFAQRCFGKATIDDGIEKLRAVLRSWGYRQQGQWSFSACVSYLLLRNWSPRLEDLTSELIEDIAQSCTMACVQHCLSQATRALFELGLIAHALPEARADKAIVSGTDGSVSDEWLSWCRRWRKQTTAQSPGNTYYSLLKVGRWLMTFHREITSPADWTYGLAIEFVSAVNGMNIGEWSSVLHHKHLPAERLGQPLRPRAKNCMLQSLRVFLRDCQEWQWIPVHLNPDRALRTPQSIRKLTGPSPRVVDKEIWAIICTQPL
jgi:hypothetical protein